MRVSQYRDFLAANLPRNQFILCVGPQGIGKTQVVQDLASDLGWDWYAICMPMIDPSYILGYPFRDGDRACHLPFGVLAKCLKATKDTVLILDEIGGAGETVMKAVLRFMQFREVGEARLPECVHMVAMSNDVTHGAAVLGMVEPAKSRFDTIVNVEPHVDDTVVYGLNRGWPTWLLAFLRNNPDALYDYKPCKSMQIGGADPRGWERIARWDSLGELDKPYAQEVVCGRVGKGQGTKALAFRELAAELPDIDGCLLDPDGSPVPENPSARYMVSMAMAAKMTAGNFGSAVRYLNRLPQMFRAFSIRDAFRAEAELRKQAKLPKDHRALASSRDFTAWATSSDGKAVMEAAS